MQSDPARPPDHPPHSFSADVGADDSTPIACAAGVRRGCTTLVIAFERRDVERVELTDRGRAAVRDA